MNLSKSIERASRHSMVIMIVSAVLVIVSAKVMLTQMPGIRGTVVSVLYLTSILTFFVSFPIFLHGRAKTSERKDLRLKIIYKALDLRVGEQTSVSCQGATSEQIADLQQLFQNLKSGLSYSLDDSGHGQVLLRRLA